MTNQGHPTIETNINCKLANEIWCENINLSKNDSFKIALNIYSKRGKNYLLIANKNLHKSRMYVSQSAIIIFSL